MRTYKPLLALKILPVTSQRPKVFPRCPSYFGLFRKIEAFLGLKLRHPAHILNPLSVHIAELLQEWEQKAKVLHLLSLEPVPLLEIFHVLSCHQLFLL